MPFKYQLSEEAENDIEDGYLWYEIKKKGLGEEFLKSLDLAKAAILSNPKTYRLRYKDKVRCFVVDRFPYLVLYVVKSQEIKVISVFNTNQHPMKWKKRV